MNIISVSGALYEGNIGDGIPEHSHEQNSHGHLVIKGRTLLHVEGRPSFNMTPVDGNYEFPINKKHSVDIVEDGTAFLHLSKQVGTTTGCAVVGCDGGVMLHDGTIVHAD
jgi:quercetin dioxygenase-like cupin family protein